MPKRPREFETETISPKRHCRVRVSPPPAPVKKIHKSEVPFDVLESLCSSFNKASISINATLPRGEDFPASFQDLEMLDFDSDLH